MTQQQFDMFCAEPASVSYIHQNRFSGIDPETITDEEGEEILALAKAYAARKMERKGRLKSSTISQRYLLAKYRDYAHEVFGIIYLDTRHGVIDIEILFQGDIDGCSVYPRQVVKNVLLQRGCSAVMFFHNHPSGNPQPSQADKRLTEKLKECLDMVDVRVLDHIVLGAAETFSFAESGLI